MTDTKTGARGAFATAVFTWIAGLIAAASCLGMPFAAALLTALGAGAFATRHALLIPIFEAMLLAAAACAAWLAHRTGRSRAYAYLAASVLLAGIGIFFHAAPVFAGMALLALVTARLLGHARAAGIC
ncbi:MAG TPA: hypothetical protein VNM24_14800 [Burkholderiales bacterium]|jgi:hypothetical protein|nr:hypothetical protein [Burkholderiales bacterium]